MRQSAQGEPYNPPALYSIRQGTVMGIHPFGAFVRLDGEEKDALVHVTQLKVGREAVGGEGGGWAGRGCASASVHVLLWRALRASAHAPRSAEAFHVTRTRQACAGGAFVRRGCAASARAAPCTDCAYLAADTGPRHPRGWGRRQPRGSAWRRAR